MGGDRKISSGKKLKNRAIEIATYAEDIIAKDKSKKGVLLCEGTKTSLDVMLYSEVYPEFVVVPSDGCSDIRRLLPFMKKYCEYETVGIIDRDNKSKKQIRMLQKEHDIYCTKLPFIENIVCCPEVLKIIAKIRGKDYTDVLKKVRACLSSLLAEKLSLLNPFNFELPDEEVQMVTITIVTQNNFVHKNIDLSNIMYTFRDKAIAGKVADALDMHSREEYYNFLRECIKGEYGDKLIFVMSKYLPKLSIDKDET